MPLRVPSLPRLPGAAGALGLGGSSLLCSVLALALLAFGRPSAALGAGLGLALHLTNALFLYATLSALAERAKPSGGAAIATLASVGRYLLLAFVLWWITAALGRETFFGAGGGLALAQISLFFRRSDAKGGA